MKGLRVISILSLLVAVFLGCSSGSQTQNKISIAGEVMKESYMTMGGSASPIAYLVKVTIKNEGENPIEFDEIEANFFPPQGNSLKILRSKYDKKDVTDREVFGARAIG